MTNHVSFLAGNMGGGGFPGGGLRPGLPLGDVTFDFDWVYTVLAKLLSALGTVFDLAFNPMYTWIDYVLRWFGFSDLRIKNIIDTISKMDFFQMNFFELIFDLLPIVIAISLMAWVFRALDVI